jgi:ubiquinone/menaquinone biosynthesis C-methylase UbiE
MQSLLSCNKIKIKSAANIMSVNATFDAIAANYDADFANSAVGRLQRASVYRFLEEIQVLEKKLFVLEINCGTGEDALWLAKNGNSVLATDASEEMINVAKQKVASLNLPDLQFQQAEFSALKVMYSQKKFDLIFSNFGGLNCIDETQFKHLMDDFYSLLKPEGKLIFVIMGRKCLWERLYFLFKGSRKSAFRRMSRIGIPAQLGNGAVQKTFYFSPSEIKSLVSLNFQVLKSKPIGLFLPPSYLDKFFNNKKPLLLFLYQLEKLFSRFSFLSNYADHYTRPIPFSRI